MTARSLESMRIAVLMGGWASERDVSLDSGRQVTQGLLDAGLTAEAVDVTRENLLSIDPQTIDLAFIVLHGAGGEDGTAQSVLDVLGIPFTGSGVAASALAMDKLRTKLVWKALGIPTPAFEVVDETTDAATLVQSLGLPLFIKPANEGSSIGLSRVGSVDEVMPAITKALAHDRIVFAESNISGGEYTAGILGNESLPLLKIETDGDYYDYEAKYVSNKTRYLCPCDLSAKIEAQFQQLTRRAFDAVGATGWGRVDFMLDDQMNPWLLELNTVPGMTSHSLVPMAAKVAGIEFPQLVRRIAELALAATQSTGALK